MKYKFATFGRAAQGLQTWSMEGYVEASAGELPHAIGLVMHRTFEGLTDGKAIFGRPGVGCTGPYQISKLVIEEVDEHGEAYLSGARGGSISIGGTIKQVDSPKDGDIRRDGKTSST